VALARLNSRPAIAIEHHSRAATLRTVRSRGSGNDEPTTHAALPRPSQLPPPLMPVKVLEAGAVATPGEPRGSRRERDIALFRERRDQVVRQARAEAAGRIARDGTLATVFDALAAIHDPQAACWAAEHEQLDQTLAAGARKAAAARRALRRVSRDAARTTRHARHDPELAFAVCVAYAIVVRLGRTAVRIHQRDAHPIGAREILVSTEVVEGSAVVFDV